MLRNVTRIKEVVMAHASDQRKTVGAEGLEPPTFAL
jgi:hypothetical protein